MSVILNEAALRALLHAPTGPVFREIERRGLIAQHSLQTRIDGIIANPPNRPQAGLEITPEGAIIGIRDEAAVRTSNRESISEYLDFKLGVQEPWWDEVGEPAQHGPI